MLWINKNYLPDTDPEKKNIDQDYFLLQNVFMYKLILYFYGSASLKKLTSPFLPIKRETESPTLGHRFKLFIYYRG